jgi:elongation factor 2
LAKSPNKHNRLYFKAEPLAEELCQAIEANIVNPFQDVKKRSKLLCNEFAWEKQDTLKIWGFGPAPETSGGAYGANLLVDQTKAVQYLNEIRESVNSGLLWAARQGPLCEERMRGIRFNLLDVTLHADSIHRGMGQIQPTARRAFFASAMTAQCRFQEPVFAVTVDSAVETQPGIMQALGSCRGEYVESEVSGDRLWLKAFVPISETLGATPFATVLSQKTNGKALASYVFDHWETMNADPMDWDKKTKLPKSKTAELMLAIRTRKGLKLEPPELSEYLDKL